MPWPDRKISLDIAGLQGRADVLEEAVSDLDMRETIGLAVHKTTGAIVRIGNKSTVSTGSYIGDDASSLLERCSPVVLTDAGVEYKEISKLDLTRHIDGTPVALTGATGQLMVRHSAGFIRHADIGDYVVFAVSPRYRSGYDLDPAFPDDETPFYSGIYEASAVPGDTKLSSICLDPRDGSSPVWPLTSRTSDEWGRSSMTAEAVRLLAADRGAGWTTEKYHWWAWRTLLAMIAFGSMNSQSFCGTGRTGLTGGVWKRDIDDTNTGYIGRCGLMNAQRGYAVQVATGFLAAGSRVMWVENSYGNVWQSLPDVLVDAANAGSVKLYVKSSPPYSVSSLTGYEVLKTLAGSDIVLPGTSGYKGTPVPGQPLHSAAATGDSTKFLGDNFYVAITGALRGALVGSTSYNGTAAGAGAWTSAYAASHSSTHIGSRAGFQKS